MRAEIQAERCGLSSDDTEVRELFLRQVSRGDIVRGLPIFDNNRSQSRNL